MVLPHVIVHDVGSVPHIELHLATTKALEAAVAVLIRDHTAVLVRCIIARANQATSTPYKRVFLCLLWNRVVFSREPKYTAK